MYFLIHLNTYGMDLRLLETFYFCQCGDRLYTSGLYTSESDVHRRQILTYKGGPALKGIYEEKEGNHK